MLQRPILLGYDIASKKKFRESFGMTFIYFSGSIGAHKFIGIRFRSTRWCTFIVKS
jgi:hypothetical protein